MNQFARPKFPIDKIFTFFCVIGISCSQAQELPESPELTSSWFLPGQMRIEWTAPSKY